jgi:hypothetical protein
MFLYICGDMCCDRAEVVNVKCDLQPDRAQCSMSKVRCSVVLRGLQAVSFLHKENCFTLCAFEQRKQISVA